jgi:hypothetical protein
MSPDWAANATAVPYADFGDPQSLNLYGYVRNNPMSHADVDGHCFWDVCVVEAAAVVTLAAATAVAVHNFSNYINSPQGQSDSRAVVQSVSNAVHAVASALKPGTKGKPDHQQTAKEEAAKIGGQTEVRIPTPGGSKGTRVADAARVDPATGAVEAVTQVIRPTPAGNVPKREQEAAKDIQNATGVTPTLVPVRPVTPPPPPKPEPLHTSAKAES